MDSKSQIRRIIREVISKTAFRKNLGYYSPFKYKKGYVIEFEDIPGLHAIRGERYDYPSWVIYQVESSEPIGVLDGGGELEYRTQIQKLVWTDWVVADRSFGEDLKNAMRYVYMKIQEKAGILKEDEKYRNEIVKVKGIPHIYAHGTGAGDNWTILMKIKGGGVTMGALYDNVLQLSNDLFPAGTEIEMRASGPTDAIEIIWNKLEKSFLEGFTPEQLFAFKILSGMWYIISKDGEVARLNKNGALYLDSPEGGSETHDIRFKDDIKNAMRMAWLKKNSTEPRSKIRREIRDVLSEDETIGIPRDIHIVLMPANAFYVEHRPGKKLSSWLGGVHNGKLVALSSDYFTEHRISDATKTKDEAVKRILQWYKELDDIEVGKTEQFPGGIWAEQSVAEGDGKMWVLMDKIGRIAGKYYANRDYMELDSGVFEKLERDGGEEALFKTKVGGLKNAAFAIFAALVNVGKKKNGAR